MEKNENFGIKFVVLAVIIFLIWIGYGYYAQLFRDWVKISINDRFSALSTLFSGLAFAGLITTIYIQQKQIESQRKGFIESQKMRERTVLAEERAANAQENTAKLQENISKIQEETSVILKKQAMVSGLTARFSAVKTLYDVYTIEDNMAEKRGVQGVELIKKREELQKQINAWLAEMAKLKAEIDSFFK